MSTPQRISLSLLLALKLILGVVGAASVPLWIGHEADYFSVVRFLAENGRLPARTDFDGAARGADISQATQPPLFTFVAAPLVALLDDNTAVPPGRHPPVVCEGAAPTAYPYVLTTAYNLPLGGAPAAGYSLRLLNLLFALGMTLIVYHTTRALTRGHHSTALVAAAFVAFQPQLFDLGIFISGESLLLLISSANLYFAVRLVRGAPLRPADLGGLILTAILGPLTKTNGYVLIIGTAAVLLYLLLLHVITSPRSRTTRLLLAAVGVLVVGIVAISLFNYAQYGSVIGRYQNLLNSVVNRLGDFNQENLVSTLRDTYYDYVSVFPVQRQKLLWLYTVFGVFGLVMFVASLAVAIIRRDRQRLSPHLMLLVYALAAVALVMMRGNLVNDLTPDKVHTPVRYYVSGLPAMAILSALGWGALIPAKPRDWLVTRVGGERAPYRRLLAWNWPGLLWALVWSAVVVWTVADHVLAHPARHVSAVADFAALAAQKDLTRVAVDPALPADMPRLRAYEYSAGDDGMLHLTAYMHVAETPTLNYVARVMLGDGGGSTSSCELIPQDGEYPVTRWEPDQIVAVQMDIPNCAAGGDGELSGPLDVTLEWLPADLAGQFLGTTRSVSQHISVDMDLPPARSCLNNIGVFEDTFQVVVYNGPNRATIGEVYLPSVNWYVRTAIENTDRARVYVLTHPDTGQNYTCTGPPRLGDYPIHLWRRGEIIYFDQCAIRLPPDALPGEYNVSMGMIDNATGQYVRVEPHEGTISADGLLNVTTLTVEPRR